LVTFYTQKAEKVALIKWYFAVANYRKGIRPVDDASKLRTKEGCTYQMQFLLFTVSLNDSFELFRISLSVNYVTLNK